MTAPESPTYAERRRRHPLPQPSRVGPGKLSVIQSVFGPHLGCVRLSGDARDGVDPDVKMNHCSLLMADGSCRFINENIQHTETNFVASPSNVNGPYGVWQRLSGINDTQPIPENF